MLGAKVRREIVIILRLCEEPLTLRQLECAVGCNVQLGAGDLTEHVVAELLSVGIIEETPDRRRFRLTEAGLLRHQGLLPLRDEPQLALF